MNQQDKPTMPSNFPSYPSLPTSLNSQVSNMPSLPNINQPTLPSNLYPQLQIGQQFNQIQQKQPIFTAPTLPSDNIVIPQQNKQEEKNPFSKINSMNKGLNEPPKFNFNADMPKRYVSMCKQAREQKSEYMKPTLPSTEEMMTYVRDFTSYISQEEQDLLNSSQKFQPILPSASVELPQMPSIPEIPTQILAQNPFEKMKFPTDKPVQKLLVDPKSNPFEKLEKPQKKQIIELDEYPDLPIQNIPQKLPQSVPQQVQEPRNQISKNPFQEKPQIQPQNKNPPQQKEIPKYPIQERPQELQTVMVQNFDQNKALQLEDQILKKAEQFKPEDELDQTQLLLSDPSEQNLQKAVQKMETFYQQFREEEDKEVDDLKDQIFKQMDMVMQFTAVAKEMLKANRKDNARQMLHGKQMALNFLKVLEKKLAKAEAKQKNKLLQELGM